MPTLPRYDTPQVEAKPLPGFRQDSVATPSMLGGMADSTAKLGEGLVTAGNAAATIFTRMQERDDMTAVLGVEAKVKEDLIAYDADMRKNRQGEKADKVTQDVKDWWDERKRVDSEVLKNDRQRELYQRRLTTTRLQSLHTASQFEAQQKVVALDLSSKASVTASINAAAAAVKPDSSLGDIDRVVAIEVDNIRRTNSALAMTKGIVDPKVLDVINGVDITRLHKQVIEALGTDNKDLAVSYFQKYEKDIDGGARNQLGEHARKATSYSTGRRAAQDVIAEVGYKAGLDKVLEAVRAKVGDKNPFALDVAEAHARNLVADYKTGEATRVQADLAPLSVAMANGASWAQIQGMPSYLSLVSRAPNDPAAEAAIAQIHFRAKQLEATAAAKASSQASAAYTNERRNDERLARANLPMYLDLLANPEKVQRLSNDQVTNLSLYIGPEHAVRIATMRGAMEKNPDASKNYKLDNDIFKAIANSAGLDDPKKTGAAAREQVDRQVRLRNAIDDRLLSLTRIKKAPLTPEERRDEARRVADDLFRQPGFLGFGGASMPYSAMTDEERRTAVITLPGAGAIKVADIPPPFIADFELAAYRNRAPKPTMGEIAKAWHDDGAKWRNKTKGERPLPVNEIPGVR